MHYKLVAHCILSVEDDVQRLLIKRIKYKLHIFFTKQKRFRPILSNIQQNNLLISSTMIVSMHSTTRFLVEETKISSFINKSRNID